MEIQRHRLKQILFHAGFFCLVLILILGCGVFASPVGIQNLSPKSEAQITTNPLISPLPSQTPRSDLILQTITPAAINPTYTEKPTSTSTATAVITPLACLPQMQPAEFGLVKRVISGDKILVDIQGKTRVISYAGITAPLLVPVIEEFGPPAATSNALMVEDQVVGLIRDGIDQNQDGSLIRYVVVYNQDVFTNYELLYAGLVHLKSASQDLLCFSTFQQAQESARLAKRGLWASTPTRLPTITTRPTSSRTPTVTLTPSLTPTPTVTGTPPTTTPSLTPTVTPSPTTTTTRTATATFGAICDLNYEDVCIPPPPPYMTCADIPYTNFKASFIDPHDFDKNFDGIGCGPGD